MITPAIQNNPDHDTPIAGCFFLAVPHRGTGNADFLNHFLSGINTLLPPGLKSNRLFVKDLRLKNAKLADITDRFVQLLNGNDIRIISCYENNDYARGKGKVGHKFIVLTATVSAFG